jgi:hypothetical protein
MRRLVAAQAAILVALVGLPMHRDATTFTVSDPGGSTTYSLDGGVAPSPTTPVLASRSIDPACTFSGGFEDDFGDVPSTSVHERAVDCIVYWQVTTGVRRGVYDPSGGVTRGQMASFLARLVERSGGTLPPGPPDAFPDDDGTTHESNIDKLAAVGIAGGRTDGTFAPNGPVVRSQMATFVIRALEHRLGGPVDDGAPTSDYFTDDDGDTHETNINKVAAVGITGGTSGGGFGPHQRVRRDQMASFLARTLAELVDAGTASVPGPPPPPPPGVVVGGDSIIYDVSPALVDALHPDAAWIVPLITPALSDHASRNTLLSAVEEQNADVVFVMVGVWERIYRAPDGTTLGDPGWDDAYVANVVDPLAEAISGAGARLVLLGPPHIRVAADDAQIGELERIWAEYAAAEQGVTFLDSDPWLVDADRFVDIDGTERIRRLDGLHLCAEGARRIATGIIGELSTELEAAGTAPRPGWESGSWVNRFPSDECPPVTA